MNVLKILMISLLSIVFFSCSQEKEEEGLDLDRIVKEENSSNSHLDRKEIVSDEKDN